MLVLFVPWFLLLIVLISIVLAIKKKWFYFFATLILIVVVNNLGEVFSIHAYSSSSFSKNTQSFFSWNVDGSNYNSIKIRKVFHIIENAKPDVVFLAENYGEFACFLDSLLKNIGLKRVYYKEDNGHCFYSRYPVTGLRVIKSGEDQQSMFITGLLRLRGMSIQLYGCHLASNNYYPDKRRLIVDSLNSIEALKDYYNNIRFASKLREHEANNISEEVRKLSVPVVLMGDLNDVSGSACLNALKDAGLKDAWWEGGMGYGATISRPLPYRIDHVMYTDGIKLKMIKVIDSEGLSDHDALFAQFEY